MTTAEPAAEPAAASTDKAAAPAPAAVPVCRADAELRAWLATAWAIKPEQQVDSASCAAGAFPEPGFAITAWITPKDTSKGGPELFDYRSQIVDASGAVLADLVDPDADDPRMWLNGSTPKVQVADLDGDGAAELITTEDEITREDSDTSSLTVYQRSGATLVEAGTIETRKIDPGLANGGDPVDPNNPYGVDCAATIAMDPAKPGITLEWTSKRGAKAETTCATGTQVYVLRAGKLVLE